MKNGIRNFCMRHGVRLLLVVCFVASSVEVSAQFQKTGEAGPFMAAGTRWTWDDDAGEDNEGDWVVVDVDYEIELFEFRVSPNDRRLSWSGVSPGFTSAGPGSQRQRLRRIEPNQSGFPTGSSGNITHTHESYIATYRWEYAVVLHKPGEGSPNYQYVSRDFTFDFEAGLVVPDPLCVTFEFINSTTDTRWYEVIYDSDGETVQNGIFSLHPGQKKVMMVNEVERADEGDGFMVRAWSEPPVDAMPGETEQEQQQNWFSYMEAQAEKPAVPMNADWRECDPLSDDRYAYIDTDDGFVEIEIVMPDQEEMLEEEEIPEVEELEEVEDPDLEEREEIPDLEPLPGTASKPSGISGDTEALWDQEEANHARQMVAMDNLREALSAHLEGLAVDVRNLGEETTVWLNRIDNQIAHQTSVTQNEGAQLRREMQQEGRQTRAVLNEILDAMEEGEGGGYGPDESEEANLSQGFVSGHGESDIEGRGEQAQGAAEAQFPEVGLPPLNEIGGGDSGIWLVELNFGSINYGTVDLHPLSNDNLQAVAVWMRGIFTFAILFFLGWYMIHQASEYFQSIASAQQARGNAIFGGTGGQATALLAATLISAVILTMPLILYVFVFEAHFGFSIGHIFEASSNPWNMSSGGAMLQEGVKLIDAFVPLTHLIIAGVLCLVTRVAGDAVFTGVALFIRFVTP